MEKKAIKITRKNCEVKNKYRESKISCSFTSVTK